MVKNGLEWWLISPNTVSYNSNGLLIPILYFNYNIHLLFRSYYITTKEYYVFLKHSSSLLHTYMLLNIILG